MPARLFRICLIVVLAVILTLPCASLGAAQDPPLGLAIADGAPAAALDPVLRALAAAGIRAQPAPAGSPVDLQLVNAQTSGATLAWERVFTPVGPLSSLLDSLTLAELKGVWTGAGKSPNFARLYVTAETAALLTPLLGPPGANVKTVAENGLEAAVWGDKAGGASSAPGIAPFDALTVRLRALKLDGNSTVDNRFRAAEWPLTARASLVAASDRGREALSAAAGSLPATNRDPSKLTVLVMTGVTAMSRHSAAAIEKSGDYGFLARKVGPELAAADITTTSNESPFAAGCKVNTAANNYVLCSKPEYWENLALSGIDAVGLTGNHVLDSGVKGLLATLALYQEKQVRVYGGGANEKAAAEPLVLEHNGNRISFVGANQFGPATTWAGPDKPGSARFDLAKLQASIKTLKAQGGVVLAEVQALETNYQGNYVNVPNRQAETDFRALSDAGADVVTGIMAHAPQAVETRQGRLILYGLGNLYFDQTWSWPTRTGLVPRYTIYDGKLINTELLVTVIDKNFQLRWATPAERSQVLRSIFDVSRFKG